MTGKPAGMFGRLASAFASARERSAVVWQPEGQVYPRLLSFEPRALAGRAGLYLVWHLGVRPQWLRVGFTTDLAAAAALLAKAPDLAAFAPHDGPFLSWSFCERADAPGFVNFLAAQLRPAAQDILLTCDVVIDPAAPAVACSLPAGTKAIASAFNVHADRL